MRAVLDEDDFKKLIRGEVIDIPQLGNLQIALSDIGYPQMIEMLGAANMEFELKQKGIIRPEE